MWSRQFFYALGMCWIFSLVLAVMYDEGDVLITSEWYLEGLQVNGFIFLVFGGCVLILLMLYTFPLPVEVSVYLFQLNGQVSGRSRWVRWTLFGSGELYDWCMDHIVALMRHVNLLGWQGWAICGGGALRVVQRLLTFSNSHFEAHKTNRSSMSEIHQRSPRLEMKPVGSLGSLSLIKVLVPILHDWQYNVRTRLWLHPADLGLSCWYRIYLIACSWAGHGLLDVEVHSLKVINLFTMVTNVVVPVRCWRLEQGPHDWVKTCTKMALRVLHALTSHPLLFSTCERDVLI